jgi:hypothetical protein
MQEVPTHMTLSLPPLLDAPPESDQLTDYDRENFATYLILLDWSAGGGDWYGEIHHLLGSDDRDRWRKIYDAHLARAEWTTRTGYRMPAVVHPPVGR